MISFITFSVCSLQILYFQHTHPVVSDFAVSAFKGNNSISFPSIMTHVVRFFFKIAFCLWWVFVADRSAVLQSWQARASPCSGSSCGRAQALGSWTRSLWGSGLVAPQHVGSSWTTDRTGVPCIARQILNHWTNREAPVVNFYAYFLSSQGAFLSWVDVEFYDFFSCICWYDHIWLYIYVCIAIYIYIYIYIYICITT